MSMEGGRMTRIGRIFTDLCLSVSSAQSVFYHKKPQINADERRLIAIIHRKGREERKAQLHKSLYLEGIIQPGTRMTRIKRIYTDYNIRAINTELVRTETNSGYSTFGG